MWRRLSSSQTYRSGSRYFHFIAPIFWPQRLALDLVPNITSLIRVMSTFVERMATCLWIVGERNIEVLHNLV